MEWLHRMVDFEVIILLGRVRMARNNYFDRMEEGESVGIFIGLVFAFFSDDNKN